MSASTSAARPRASTKKKTKRKPGATWVAWWPVALGIAVTPFAMRAADVFALQGPDALRNLYPWVAILRHHTPWLSSETSSTVAQAMMYLQFVLYGIFLKIALRHFRIFPAVLQTVMLHVLGIGFLIAVAYSHS